MAVLQLHGLRWYGHALLKCENEWVQECMDCEDEYVNSRSKRTWKEGVEAYKRRIRRQKRNK